MDALIPLVGSWFWWIVAAFLLFGELLAPGVFLLWLAIAAALTGIADLAFHLNWQMEIAVFSALSAVLVAVSWRWVMAQRQPKSDQPHLNQRINAFVGRRVVLAQAIVNGSGKVRIDDALWDVDGPDLPKGTQVVITGVNGLRLTANAVN